MRNNIRARSAGKAKAWLGPRRAAPEEGEEAEVVVEAAEAEAVVEVVEAAEAEVVVAAMAVVVAAAAAADPS
jgi:hypothetical protein